MFGINTNRGSFQGDVSVITGDGGRTQFARLFLNNFGVFRVNEYYEEILSERAGYVL
jgi:hypothetical protein